MPGAGPEQGSWDFPPVEDFEASSEKALISFLAKKQKAGADINAYRHLGTLLHHAIRAGQVATAQWLLAHGADPRKKVLQGGQDALGLAETYKRSELVRLLQTRYGMAQPQRPPVQPPAVAAVQPTTQDQLRALLYSARRQVKDGKTTSTSKTPPEAWRALWRKLDSGKRPARLYAAESRLLTFLRGRKRSATAARKKSQPAARAKAKAIKRPDTN